MDKAQNAGRSLQLALATTSFAICFAAWGLISAFAPTFRELFQLSASGTAALVAVPVLLGSVARLPMGLLADRFGGRIVFAALAVIVAVPVALVPQATSYTMLVATGFFLGLAGSSFAVGVAFVSPWFPKEKQGSALGVYGAGNIGQSIAVFGGPVLAAAIGWQGVFRWMAVVLVAWAAVFGLVAQNSANRPPRKTAAEMLSVLARERLSWALSAFYFLTFGGFVAFSVYLPTLLKDQFSLTAADAGFRTAGFVALATLCRPAGGWLADRIGGARVLNGVFLGVIPFALLMSWASMVPFTVGALGCAALLGFGNGAVFKLVPEYFPTQTGTVTGLVGAVGGLGGFFPPLLLGFFRDTLGTVWPGYVLLAIVSFVLCRVNARTFLARQAGPDLHLSPELRRAVERLRATAWGVLVTAVLAALIVVGSRNLAHFDAALVGYTFATLFATFAIAYRYAMWLNRPPTRMYWRRGWQAFATRGRLAGNTASLGRRAIEDFALNRFIFRRAHLRGLTHSLIMWGCIIAAAITFPLVWGWVHFETVPGDLHMYRTFVFGVPVQDFPVDSLAAFLIFHGLVWSSFLVIAGVMLAFRRRMIDHGAVAVQQFGQDILPLLLLFGISVSGLMLTASYTWMKGYAYEFLAILHAALVIVTLLWLPFGKLFHIFQRPAQIGVAFYKDAGARGEAARCVRCGQPYAPAIMVRDLKTVEAELGFKYELAGGAHYQDVCPKCRRALFGLAQGQAWGEYLNDRTDRTAS